MTVFQQAVQQVRKKSKKKLKEEYPGVMGRKHEPHSMSAKDREAAPARVIAASGSKRTPSWVPPRTHTEVRLQAPSTSISPNASMSSESYLAKTNVSYKPVENTNPKGKSTISLARR